MNIEKIRDILSDYGSEKGFDFVISAVRELSKNKRLKENINELIRLELSAFENRCIFDRRKFGIHRFGISIFDRSKFRTRTFDRRTVDISRFERRKFDRREFDRRRFERCRFEGRKIL